MKLTSNQQASPRIWLERDAEASGSQLMQRGAVFYRPTTTTSCTYLYILLWFLWSSLVLIVVALVDEL